MRNTRLPFIFLLLLMLAFAANAQETYTRANLWTAEMAAFTETDRRQTPPESAVLFTGSSSIRGWNNLRASFPNLKVINRGFGGSHLEDVNYYFDRLVTAYKPKAIVLYAGENDITAGKTPETVAKHYREFAQMVHANLPKTKLFFVSLKPSPSRWKLADQFRKANDLIKADIARDKNATYVDVWTPMLAANGEPMPDIFLGDNLHMNEKGFAIWKKVLDKYLK